MPVTFPGAFGYGSATRGAFSGPVAPIFYKVTTLQDTALNGSLRFGLAMTVPRVIIFEIAGQFEATDMFRITSPYCTIAGETAPDPGVEIYKYGFFVTTHNVVWRHIAVRPGEWGFLRRDNCGLILYDVNAHDHMYDHVSIAWGPDENFAADKYGSAPANVSWNRCFSMEGLNYPVSVDDSGSFGMLVQAPTKLVNMSQCVIANCAFRCYYAQSGTSTAMTNCVIYNGFSIVAGPQFTFADINSNPGTEPIWASIAGNHAIAGPQTGTDSTYPNQGNFISLLNSFGVVAGSKLYRSDNLITTYPGVTYHPLENFWGYDPFQGTPPAEAPLTGFTVWSSSLTKTWAMRRAGTRPANRPEVDRRVMAYILTQGGPGYINTQNVVGGYPPLTPTTRALPVPANATATNPATGYTFGEEWLQSYAWAVQGITINVAAGEDLQTVLNMAEPGDTIVLQQGATFTGNYILPVHPGAGYITIKSGGSIPTDGTRVTPQTATTYAKLKAPAGGSPALATAVGAAYWNIIGVEFPPNPGGFNDIIRLGDGSSAQNALSQVPQNIILDRCYIHGDPLTGQKRGISLQSGNTVIKNCYISDIFAVGQDSQAIAGWNGTGPYLIDNNYIEAASENVLFGGDEARILNQLPSDVTFTNNLVAKKTAWRGKGYNVKNLFELKFGQRMLIDSNIFEYNWAEAQTGYAILFNVRNGDIEHVTPWATTRDIKFTRNVVRHTGAVFQILGLDDRPGITSVLMSNILIQDTQAWDVTPATWGGPGHFALVQKGDRLTFNHNTAVLNQTGQDVSVYLLGTNALPNFVFTNNILPCAPVPNLVIYGDQSLAAGIPTLQNVAPGYVCARNVIYGNQGVLSNYPPDATYPTIDGVGFVDRFNNDYRLSTGSVYINAGLDGTDIGSRFGNATGGGGTPPDVPGNPVPVNNATNVLVSTAVSWGAAARAVSYDVAFGTSSPPPTVATGVTGLSYDPPGNLAFGTTYFWQITASNTAGSAVSPIWNFTTVPPTTPGTPSNPSPATSATDVAVTSALSWSATVNTDAYTVKFGTINPPPTVGTVTTPTYDPPGNLAFSTTYFWQIIATNNQGGSTAGPIWTFSTIAAVIPPTAPTTPTPTNNAIDRPITQTIAWAGDTGATNYTVAFGTSNPPPIVAGGVTVRSYDPGALAYSTTYFWRITANNSAGSASSIIWRFTTVAAPPPPDEPTNPAPADTATDVAVTTDVSWDPAARATSYTVKFGTVNPPPTVSTGQTGVSYNPPGNLEYLTLYYWQVIATNSSGSTPGQVWTFTTETEPVIPIPPDPPTDPVPTNGATDQALNATLAWGGGAGATNYTVAFGTTSPPPVVAGGVLVQNYNPGALQYATTYFWRITANNADGSTNGAIWSFSTLPLPTPPAQPSNPIPVNNATAVAITTGVSWAVAARATSYTVKFGTTNPPPTVSTSQTGTSYAPLGALLYSTVYFWQVIAENAGGTTAGAVWRFTTRAQPNPPTAPTNPVPANASTGRPITQTLSWGGGIGATSFTVAFGVTPTPPVITNTATASYNPGTLQYATTYYWRITANNADGSTSGATWSFTTAAPPPPPDTPSGPNPSNGALNVSITSILSWAVANGATSYHVNFGTTSPPPRVSSGQTGRSYNPAPRTGPRRNRTLSNSTTYYWQITANNAAGSTVGPIWVFTTEASSNPTVPAAPANPAPTDGETGVAREVVLGWDTAAFATSYQVAFGVSNPPPVVVTSQTALTYDPPGLLTNGQTYFWRVTSVNAVGSTAGPIWSFTVVTLPLPGDPSNPSPADAATAIDVTTALSWSGAINADSYTVKFGTVTPPVTVVASGQTGTTFSPPTVLANNTLYYWQVLAVNTAGTTAGPIWSFTTRAALVPPTTPTTPSPADAAIGVANTPVLTWGGGIGATGFSIAFGTSSPPPLVTTSTTASYTPGTLLFLTTYYWQITAFNNDGSAQGAIWSFTTLAAGPPPGTPSVPDPANGALDVPVTSNLDWEDVTGAETYDVAFGTVNPPPTVSTDQVDSLYDPLGNLAFTTVYYWKVTAKNQFGSTAGAVWSFTTADEPVDPNPPDPPTTPSPEDGATGQLIDTTLGWGGAAGALTYTVAFGTSSPPPVVAGGLIVQAYDPGDLEYATTYYWRITANNDDGSTDGAIWSFSTTGPPEPPEVPTTPDPADLAIDISITTPLGWVNGARTDTVAIGFGTVNPPPIIASGETGENYIPALLEYETVYYWQITAANAGGTTPGPVWSFTTIPEPPPDVPDTPSTPSPTNGATDVSITPTLSWAPAARADTYSIAIGVVNPPAATAGGLTDPSYVPGTLAYSTTYFWRVTANNEAGSTVGPVWSFTTVASPPAPDPPTSPTPANGAIDVAVTTSLSWVAGANTDTMDVAFGTVSPPPTVATGQTEVTYDPPGNLLYSTTYYWRITAHNAYGDTVGTIWSFTTAASPPPDPPTTPHDPAPTDGATGVPIASLLGWSSENAVNYDLSFGTTVTPPLLISGLPTPSYDPPIVAYAQTYYWQVVANNASGSATGPVWSFTSEPPPDCVSLLQSSDLFYIVTSDGHRLAVAAPCTTTTARLTQLALQGAYDYAILIPHLDARGQRWATPWKRC